MGTVDYIAETESGQLQIEVMTRDMGRDIVDQLIRIRKDKGLSQQEVADAAGLPRANISRIERKLYTPTLAVLSKYAAGLGKKLRLEIEDMNEG